MKYIPSIGIECHVQLNTHTKLFAAVGNDARNAEPNTLISPICLGLPGTLPVLNQAAVDKAARFAFAVNSRPEKHSIFERKHYFYPDLPKGYQITQLSQPIVKGGHVEIDPPAGGGGQTKIVRLNRVQLEEDAGKNTHPDGKDYSLVDLNRAGTPLLEIVSEPDMHSAEEAKAYVKELYLLMKYADVSDVDLFHGNMRFDVNVSVSKDDKLGTRSETKNLNSFKSVEKAVEYEVKRQIELLEKGQPIVQETRGWDDAKQKTFSQRSKEDAHDYRYFPDPDIPPVELTDAAIEGIKSVMPPLPNDLRARMHELKMDKSSIETLVEEMPAGKIIFDLLDNARPSELVKRIANWLVTYVQAVLTDTETDWEDLKLDPEKLIELAQMTQENKISSTGAKTVLLEMIK